MVISLVTKGLTTGEVSAHMAEVYGADVSRDTISRITNRILEEMSDWPEPASRLGVSDGVHSTLWW